MQVADAFFEEVTLVVYEKFGDAVESTPTTLDAVNEELGVVALGVQIALYFGGRGIAAGRESLSGIDGEGVAFGFDQFNFEAIFVFADENVGADVGSAGVALMSSKNVGMVSMGGKWVEFAADVKASLAYFLL